MAGSRSASKRLFGAVYAIAETELGSVAACVVTLCLYALRSHALGIYTLEFQPLALYFGGVPLPVGAVHRLLALPQPEPPQLVGLGSGESSALTQVN